MPAIDIGDPLPGLAVTFTSDGTATGTPVDPGGGVVLTIYLPDGSTVEPSVTHGGTGQWSATYVPTVGGLFRAVWVGSGTNGRVIEQTFSVGDPVGIDELRAALKLTGAASDTLLYLWVASATDWAESKSGRALRTRTVVDVKAGGKYAVALSQLPIKSVTSVSVNGDTLAADGYELHAATGLLYRGAARSGLSWPLGWVTVSYVVDADVVPANIRDGIVEYVRYRAASYRGSTGQPAAGGDPQAALELARSLIGPKIPRF